MSERRILASVVVIVMLLGLAVSLTQAQAPDPQAAAAPHATVGNAFTYQGHLDDGGNPAEGAYDFQFILYNALSGGSQVGSTVTKEDVTVINGIFTVALDFGQVFDGTGLWLEAAVRAGSSTGAYTILSPRQEITPSPYTLYAIHANRAYGLSAPDGDPVDAATVDNNGILNLAGGSDANLAGGGYLVLGETTGINLVLDNNEIMARNNGAAAVLNLQTDGGILTIHNNAEDSTKIRILNNGSVGIGTTTPSAKLDVAGDVTQDLAANGLVKAAVYASCGSVQTPSVYRYFNLHSDSITVAGIYGPWGWVTGICTVNFGFDLSARFWIAMSLDDSAQYASYDNGPVSCRLQGTNALLCLRFDDGDVSTGDMMVVVY